MDGSMDDEPPPPVVKAPAVDPSEELMKAAKEFLRLLPGYDECAGLLNSLVPLDLGHGDGLLILAPDNDALNVTLPSLEAAKRKRLALAHVMLYPTGASPFCRTWALNPTCQELTDKEKIVQAVFGLKMADGTHQRIAPDSAEQLSNITEISGANVVDRHALPDAKVTILCVSSLMMSLALDEPFAREQVGGLDAKCPVPPPGLNVLGADGHALLDVEARLYGEASGEPIRPKPTPADDERREFDGKLIPESDLFGHCPDLRLRGKTKEQQLQPVFIQKLRSGPAVRQVLQDTSPELHADERIATRGSNPSNIYTPRVRLQVDSGTGVRRALYYKTTTRVAKGRVVYNHADFLKIGLKPPKQRTIRGMTEAAKEAVKTTARALQDSYGGSADDTYCMLFSVQRADDRSPSGILSWIQTEPFALRGSYNSLSKPEQEARIEWERVHRSEAPWWQTTASATVAISSSDAGQQPANPAASATVAANSSSDADAELLLTLQLGGVLLGGAPPTTAAPASTAAPQSTTASTPPAPPPPVAAPKATAPPPSAAPPPTAAPVAMPGGGAVTLQRKSAAAVASSQARPGYERGSLLLTAVTETPEATIKLKASKREVEALRPDFTVYEDATLSGFRERIASARIWWYTGFEDNGVPVFVHEEPQAGLHIVSSGQVTSIVANAVDGGKGKLEIVVLNTCSTLELGKALSEIARVPYVVCWDGLVEDRAAYIFGIALAAAVKDGKKPIEAFERAQAKVESHTNAKGQRFKLQKVDDAVKGSEVHAVAAIVPVGLPRLLEPSKVVAPKVVAPLKEAHLREHVSTLEEPGSKRACV